MSAELRTEAGAVLAADIDMEQVRAILGRLAAARVSREAARKRVRGLDEQRREATRIVDDFDQECARLMRELSELVDDAAGVEKGMVW